MEEEACWLAPEACQPAEAEVEAEECWHEAQAGLAAEVVAEEECWH